ncbi:hypothetical protein [Solihabitans fulvus]|uniref:hypothetical protein n=1 Tax=Solihabitans fulvus TaxID=1892852 RepID=UPI001661E488
MRLARPSTPSPAGSSIHDERRRSVRGFAVTAVLLTTSFVLACLAERDIGGIRGRLDAYYALWPQQWSFFVELNTDLLAGYRVTPGEARMTPVYATGRPYLLWGLDRESYKLSSEVREIALRVPDRYWRTCDQPDPGDCGETMNTVPAYRMGSPVREPSLCGHLAVAVERVSVPAPQQLPTRPLQAHRLAAVDITCPP